MFTKQAPSTGSLWNITLSIPNSFTLSPNDYLPKYFYFILPTNYYTLPSSTIDTVQPPKPAPVSLLPVAPSLRAKLVSWSSNSDEDPKLFLLDM